MTNQTNQQTETKLTTEQIIEQLKESNKIIEDFNKQYWAEKKQREQLS